MAQSPPRTLSRLSEIAQVMVRHGFGYFFEAHRLTDLIPGRRAMELEAMSPSARGQHLREVLEELGPTFVKFGQLLSTRPDIVPPDIIAELRPLQDDVRPFPFEQAERVIEEELGNSIERLFVDFDPMPVAAASIGQVHRATLPNGRPVAVKVQRPDAARQIEADLVLLYQAAKLVRGRVRAADPAGARLPPGGPQRADLPPQLRRRPARARAEGVLDVHAYPRADARMAARHAARRRGHARPHARGAA
ncbi:MAG: AarF/ABC1/UbiB kinase family protein [Actinobacteria bacterium]|nr:MAG: AarF/ABC1/UbiB kinase family protein [Actinomycetota bacterium]